MYGGIERGLCVSVHRFRFKTLNNFLAFPGVGVDGFYLLLYSIALIEPFSCQLSVCPNTSHLYACEDLFNWSVPLCNLPKRR